MARLFLHAPVRRRHRHRPLSGPDDSLKSRPVLIWDLPTRLFHWSLVALVALSWWSGAEGGTAFPVHQWSGCAILTLLLFRLAWGVVGGEYARFTHFVHGPARVLGSLRELLRPTSRATAGHNALGGWMVVALLLSLLVQTITGLFANDDIMNEGPLYARVGKEVSERFSAVHELNFGVLASLIAVHVLAIVYHRLRKGETLTRSMLSGYRTLPHTIPAPRRASPWLAAVLLAVCAGMVALLIKL